MKRILSFLIFILLAMGASGLHSNGFSLVRHILAGRDILYTDHCDELGFVVQGL